MGGQPLHLVSSKAFTQDRYLQGGHLTSPKFEAEDTIISTPGNVYPVYTRSLDQPTQTTPSEAFPHGARLSSPPDGPPTLFSCLSGI